LFRLAKQTHSNAKSGGFESRLLSMMMVLNVGNLGRMSPDELSRLIDKG
jgi:hypothetical protein